MNERDQRWFVVFKGLYEDKEWEVNKRRVQSIFIMPRGYNHGRHPGATGYGYKHKKIETTGNTTDTRSPGIQ